LINKTNPTTQAAPAAKNRLNPIKETMQTMRGYPSTLVIYKTAASRFYWVRCYFNGKYKIKTTKSETEKSAKEFAVQFYKDTLLSSVKSQTSDRNKRFAVIGNLFFESTKNNSTSTTYKADYNRYTQHILNEFNQQEIDTITNAQISQFVEKLHATGIKPATIKHHIIVLRKIMRFAIANDLMKNLPVFPRITGKLQTSLKRDYLTVPEYDLVCKSAETLANKKTLVQGICITNEMKYLIQFMVNTFIRPSDLRVLKHKHIAHKKDGKTEWLELNHPATKTTATAVQAMPVSVHIYRNLMDYRKQAKLKTTLDDYVFLPEYDDEQRDKVMQIVAKLFKRIVAETDIQVKTDKKLTLYSLRHTAIMFRLTIGQVDTLSLARNARTSQAMIDKFYAAHLTTNQVRKQLHAFPGSTPEKRSSATKPTPAKKAAAKKTAKISK
jgi:site-specific recombinase XerD